MLIEEYPTFLDFDYFHTLFSEDGAVKFNNDQKQKSISAARQNVPKSNPEAAIVKEALKQEEEALKASELERKDTFHTIEVIQKTLPYKRFLMTENLLVPLDDDCFRDDPNIIAFKYGGKVSVLGYVTNVVKSEETPARNNSFASMYDTVNQIMISMFEGQDTIYIIHPIALFY